MEKVFFTEAHTIVSALKEARQTIATVNNPEFQAVRIKVVNQLTAMINNIRVVQMGLPPEDFLPESEAPEVVHVKHQPLTKMFGVDLTKTAEKLDPLEIERQDLIRQIDKLQDSFANLTDERVLDTVPDIVIRGLGKRLDFPFTETNPKEIKLKHVKEIRERMAEKTKIQSDENQS